jgi:hypothetical protein
MIVDGSPVVVAREAMRVGKEAVKGFTGGEGTMEMLECICRNVTWEMDTLETGSGVTTIAFLAKARAHTIVDPQRGKGCALANAFDREYRRRVYKTVRQDESVYVLPQLAASHLTYDFALMDGKDTFPDAVIDALFMARLVKPGGLLLIDDKDQDGIKAAISQLERFGDWHEVAQVARSVLWRRDK